MHRNLMRKFRLYMLIGDMPQAINSLRSFIYPNVSFEVVSNDLDEIGYLLIIVKCQTGGHFMVAEKAEKDKRLILSRVLDLFDKNDPADRRVKNYAVLMFSDHPEDQIPYAYTELIIDMFGTKRKMESKVFGNSRVVEILNCSEVTATSYLKRIL